MGAELAAPASSQGNWTHWRGPEQTGVSREKNLPDRWSPEGENLIWKAEFGSRSTPLVMNGRVYIINNAGDHPEGGASATEQERVMCFDAESGERIWEYKFNIFHTDIPSNRVGWANLAGDLDTGYIFAHGVQGLLFCFDRDGQVVWSRSLTEEFGRISGYGGRTHSPIVDEDRVIISFLSAGWGDHGRGGHRYFAFDKKNGTLLWIGEPGGRPLDTTYSTPIVSVINGQRVLIAGNADGGVYAIKARTGEKVWGIELSKRGINVSPVLHESSVYIAHSEENLDTNVQGSVLCIDATGTGDVSKTHIKWRRDGLPVGYASPVLKDGRLYVVDNAAKLICLDAATGADIWQRKLGTVGKGSPVWADGKLYATETNGRIHILQPGATNCRPLDSQKLESRDPHVNLEVYGSPAVAHGRVYVCTAEQLFAIGKKDWKPESEPIPPMPTEEPVDANASATWLQVVPAEVLAKPGESIRFAARLFDAKGRLLRETDAEWSLQAVQGKVSGAGVLALAPDGNAQGGTLQAKVGGLTGVARIRVIPPLPLAEDFEQIEEKRTPPGWIGASPVKFGVHAIDGSKVLKKLGDNAQFARADVFIGPAALHDYTIEADVRGTEKGGQMSDIGLTANRYTLELLGNNQRLRIVSWRPMPRIDEGVDFPWKSATWYHLKLQTARASGKVLVRGKAWVRGEPEPQGWQVSCEDSTGNYEGSPGLYAYSANITDTPGTEAFFDNVRVTPNAQ
jgi:outer membrane protein assembly factor BamB